MAYEAMKKPVLATDLLLLGGDVDSNLIRLIIRCRDMDVDFQACLPGKSHTPEVIYDVADNSLSIDGRLIKPKSAFVRPDVGTFMESTNETTKAAANDWFNFFIGWLLCNDDIKIFNREFYNKRRINKVHTLRLAYELGVDIPESYITNSVAHTNSLTKSGDYIYKPIDYGDFTRKLTTMPEEKYPSGVFGNIYIVQNMLEPPELRIFRIGDELFGFDVQAESLDYREQEDYLMLETGVPANLKEGIMKLTTALGLDFAALDFKFDPKKKNFMLLEVNAGPVFGGFDFSCKGRLSEAMIKYLIS